MGAGIIQQDQIQALRVSLGESIEKPLHHRGRARRKCHEVAGSTDRFDRPKHPGILETVLVDADRLHGSCGNPPPMHRLQADPTLVAGPHPHGLLIGIGNGLPEVHRKVGREIGDGRRVFLD